MVGKIENVKKAISSEWKNFHDQIWLVLINQKQQLQLVLIWNIFMEKLQVDLLN